MKTIKQYICNVRFPIVLIICLIVIGSIAYFIYTNDIKDEIVVDAQHNREPNYTQTTDHTHALEEHTQPNTLLTTVSPIVLWEQNEEIQILRDYLRIPTFHPDIIYKQCVYFLEDLAANLTLPVAIHHPVDDKNPVVVISWEGLNPELPSIVLNSHMDVVPVYESFWSYPPFGAEMDAYGSIYARGAQDMKSVGMQYLAAIRALKRDGVEQLNRTIHVLYVPDEELGGTRGMAGFVKTDEFKALNVGFLLDEGGTVENDGPLNVYSGERTIWQIEFIFHGHSGHGSRLFEDTPGEKLSYVVNKFMEFRRNEVHKLNELKYPYGNVTTINLTKTKGGVENNVIPAEMSATFDIRISINADLDAFENQIHHWLDEAGGNITMHFEVKGEKERITTTDESNPYWVAFKNAMDELGIKVVPAIRLGASDSRFVRRVDIASLGFSPMPNTVSRAHDHNEYINAGTYLRGIDVYKKIITNLGNV